MRRKACRAGPDRALAHAIAAEALRRLPDLDALIDSATRLPLADDAKARAVLRIALVQALALGTPPHAAISTALPLVDGGPRKLVHGVFGTLMRERRRRCPTCRRCPPPVAERWRAAWGDDVVAAAARAIAAPPPLDLSLKDGDVAHPDGRRRSMPRHVRLPAGTGVLAAEGFGEGGWWVQDLAASIPARLIGSGRGPRARPVRRAGRQDDAAGRRGLGRHRARPVGKSSGATFRQSRAHRAVGRGRRRRRARLDARTRRSTRC